MFLDISLIFLIPFLLFLIALVISFFLLKKQEKIKLHNFSVIFPKNFISNYYLKYSFLIQILPTVLLPFLFSFVIYVVWLWLAISGNVYSNEQTLFISFNVVFGIIFLFSIISTILVNLKIFKVKNELKNLKISIDKKGTELLEIKFCEGSYINMKNKILFKYFKKMLNIINDGFLYKKNVWKFLSIYTQITNFFMSYLIMNKEKLVLNSDLKNSFLYKQNSTIFQNASFSLTKDNRVLTPSDIHKMLIDFSNSFKLD